MEEPNRSSDIFLILYVKSIILFLQLNFTVHMMNFLILQYATVFFSTFSLNNFSSLCINGIIILHINNSRSYKRAIREFFLTTEANVDKQSAVASASGYVSDYHRFGWLLFLALRVHAFSRFKDLVTCMNGLVSILVSHFSALLNSIA